MRRHLIMRRRSGQRLQLLLRHPGAALSSRDLLYYVGVHHKTGTIWMKRLHESIARRLGLPFTGLKRAPDSSGSQGTPGKIDPTFLESTLRSVSAQRHGVVFDVHSRFAEIPRQLPRIRGVHLVRDPRDVLISATLYNLKSTEWWLHRPLPHFNNVTYQERLSSAGTMREALLFELSHQTRAAIADMAAFPRIERVPTITYESLMTGDVLAAFDEMFSSLGFAGSARRIALDCARQESIVLNPDRRDLPHVRSGETQQWRQVFDRKLGEQFAAAAGPELAALDYEPDDSWLEDLPETRPELDGSLPVTASSSPTDTADGG
jgi:hypothetical protein